jgi:hypothetical protein
VVNCSKRPERARRHRDGTRTAAEIVEEAAALERYVERHAPNRRLQMYALGAKQALDWVRLRPWEGGEMHPIRMLDLTAFALKLRGRKPVNGVPYFARRRRPESDRRHRQ